MARTKEFDATEALQKALMTFIEKGYAATTLCDLVQATGVNRQSLYNEFGDKRALYLKALEAYCSRSLEDARQILTLEQPARMVLEKLKNKLKELCLCPTASKGCLVVTTLAGATHDDPEALKVVHAMMAEKHRLLAAVIARGQNAGELPTKHSPDAVAGSLHAAVTGLAVAARGGTRCEDRQAVLDVAFEGLV